MLLYNKFVDERVVWETQRSLHPNQIIERQSFLYSCFVYLNIMHLEEPLHAYTLYIHNIIYVYVTKSPFLISKVYKSLSQFISSLYVPLFVL